eukprot:g8180.t1
MPGDNASGDNCAEGLFKDLSTLQIAGDPGGNTGMEGILAPGHWAAPPTIVGADASMAVPQMMSPTGSGVWGQTGEMTVNVKIPIILGQVADGSPAPMMTLKVPTFSFNLVGSE